MSYDYNQPKTVLILFLKTIKLKANYNLLFFGFIIYLYR